MKAQELRQKKADELNTMLNEALRTLFNLRMQKGSGQLGKPDQFSKVRREIARIKTVLHERQAGDSK